jgi:hypothetical protein
VSRRFRGAKAGLGGNSTGILRRATALALLSVLAIATSAQAGGAPAGPGGAPHSLQSYEWMPNGGAAGPQLVILVKLDITGKFAVQCGKTWIYTYFGGGGAGDPITQNAASGAISGTEKYSTNEVGIGSSFLSASTDYYLVKKAGPLVMTLNAQPSPWPATRPAGASGTIQLTLYAPGSTIPAGKAAAASKRKKHKRKHKAKAKPKTTVVASCQVPFDAPNAYAEHPEA